MGQTGSRKQAKTNITSSYKPSRSAPSLLGKQEVLLTFDKDFHSFSQDSLEQVSTSTKDAKIYRFKHLVDKMTIKSVSSGKSFAALLTTDGRLFVCGKCPFPINGPETTSVGDSADENLSQISIPISSSESIDKFSEISCGMYFMMALSQDRSRLFSAGQNECGQRGIGRGGSLNFKECIYETQTVSDKLLKGMEKISCGYQHTIAYTREGEIFGTGCSFQNQLGTIDSGIAYEFRQLSRPKTENAIVDLQAGFFFSVCLDCEGMVYVTGIRAHSNMVDAQDWTKMNTFVNNPVMAMCISCSNAFFLTRDGQVYHNLNLSSQTANNENLITLDIPAVKSIFGKESFMAVDHWNSIHVSASNGSQGVPMTSKNWFEHEGMKGLFNSKDELQIVDAFSFCIFIRSSNEGVLKTTLGIIGKKQFVDDLKEKTYFYDVQFTF